MTNSSVKRNLFLQKYKVKSPVMFTGLSPTKCGLSLFNINISSRFENVDAFPLAYVDNDITKFKNLELLSMMVLAVIPSPFGET